MTVPPRVLLLCERLDIAGGVERFVCTLANHLAGLGWDVGVGSAATRAGQVAYPLHAGVRVLHGGGGELPAGDGAWAVLCRQWQVGRTLASLIRADKPTVLVLNGLTTACSVLAWDRHCAARAVCCDHNHFDARSRPWRWLRAQLYPRVAAVVSLSQADAARYRALNARTEVIYNASLLQAEAAVPPAELQVLAVARHVAQKGLDLLLQAWVAVVQAEPAARLRIVGDGPLQAALQSQAQALGVAASVQWCPPTPDVAAHYRAAAVFVLPSRYEGMPLALLEAQALGVPAVAFDCPTGPREIVSADTGIVVPPGDVAALSQALLRLLRDPALRQRMAAAAIVRSRTHFSPAAHLQGWVALLQRVAAGGSAR